MTAMHVSRMCSLWLQASAKVGHRMSISRNAMGGMRRMNRGL